MSVLTPRQLEVLVLLYEGKSSAEAAVALGITKRTVEWHLSLIYRALGVQNILGAFQEAGRLGILDMCGGFVWASEI